MSGREGRAGLCCGTATHGCSAFQRLCCEHCRELCDLRAETRTPEDANSLPRALSTDESVGSESNLLLSKEDWRYRGDWGRVCVMNREL